jgi:ribonucrease Y
MTPIPIGIAISIIIVGLAIAKKILSEKKLQSAERNAADIIDAAKKEARTVANHSHSDAQKTANKLRREAEDEIKSRRRSISEVENRILKKEKHLDNKELQLNDKEEFIEREQEKIKALRKKEEVLINDLSGRLEKIAGITKDEAEKLLLTNVERDCKQKAGRMIKEMEIQARKIANRKAKEIIVDAIHRTAVDHVPEATTSVVQLPDDDMKGRVIGKEGRNIRAFEASTGVDVIIDDAPGTIIVSAFDPIRREIAKLSLEKLLQDGRIHPTKIEEAVTKSRKELTEKTIERGERAVDEIGLSFHPEIIKLLGKLHYRSSYGQNMLNHALESAHIAGIMAGQLGVNINLSKRGALLHDIGKAIDFEQEGSHTDLGKDICEKYGESAEVINCIMAHHEDEEPDTIEAIIVMMADAISSVRPGARRESTDTYIKRLEKLETLTRNFEGVEKAYAIQAGREVRVMVRPEEVDDDASKKLAFDIAKKIENELDYPGEVKVSVVRETRAFGIAR